MWKRISSLIVLALALIKTLLLRLVSRGSNLRRFKEHYQPEGILAVTREEAEVLAQSGRCIACGKCDGSVGVGEGSGRSLSIMTFVLSGTRSLPDYDLGACEVQSLGARTLQEAEQVCPVGVPIVALARLVEGYRERLAKPT